MRDIKYRQRLQNDKWHYWGFINGEYISPMLADGIEDAKKHSQQYTGLKDKNGKEIYEGDIVTLYDDPTYSKTKMVVEDLRSFFEAKGLGEGEYGDDYTNLEIIGNVYETPELLKE